MRIVTMLIPLSRFTVDYEVQIGRPCSELDELILRSIAEEAGSMKEIEERFKLRSRLLIEILITLFTQGWISINMEGGRDFSITRQGQAVLDEDKLPEIRRGWVRSGVVMMERLTGALIARRDVVPESERELKRSGHWERARRLAPQVTENRLDEGQVQHLLQRNRHEWVRDISRPVLASDYWWLPVDVDLEVRNVVGLPDRWAPRLKPLLIEEAESFARETPEEAAPRPYWHDGREVRPARAEPEYADWRVLLRPSADILTGEPEHATLLLRALATAASAVFISSPELDPEGAAGALSAPILEALGRGVSVDLLWGDARSKTPRARAQAVAWLRSLDAESREAGAAGQLRFNAEPGALQSALLLHDFEAPAGTLPAAPAPVGALACRVYLGSYPWLSPGGGGAAHRLTIGFQHPEALASVLRTVSAILGTHYHGRFAANDRWNNFAEELQMGPAGEPAGAAGATEDLLACRLRLVYDFEHQAVVDSLVRSAGERYALVSPLLGPAARETLSALLRRRAARTWQGEIVVAYGGCEDEPAGEWAAVEESLRAAGARVIRREGLRANLVIADATVLAGEHTPPSGPRVAAKGPARSISLMLEGRGLADLLWKDFAGGSPR